MDHNFTSVFTEGYEKGREDGLNFALTLLRMQIDYYPHSVPYALVPDDYRQHVQNSIVGFGKSQFHQGRKAEKERKQKKEASEPPCESMSTQKNSHSVSS
jgi:hypothetical protein